MCLTDHNEILHTSRQLHCRDVYKILLWSVKYISNQSIVNFGRISNSIEMPLVRQAPGNARSEDLSRNDIGLMFGNSLVIFS